MASFSKIVMLNLVTLTFKKEIFKWAVSDVTDLKPVKQHEEFLNGRSKKLTFETKQGYTSTLKEILQKIYGVTLQPENMFV